MSLELPILRIGSAGFSAEQQERLCEMLPQASPSGLRWEFGKFTEADVLWLNGGRSQLLGDGTLRIASGVPGGRSVHLRLEDVDRPVAFAIPVPRQLDPAFRFDPASFQSLAALLDRLEGGLRLQVAQFCLASQILEQESALGSGLYRVAASDGAFVALVDLRGEVGVLPTASPLAFAEAMWTAVPREAVPMPEHFTRCSLSQLMWQYALHTARDVLPARYRTERLYFRRPPRLPQRVLRDSHLLLLRELATEPGRFTELQQRTGLGDAQMAQDLGALYLVGAVTSNPRRAAQLPSRRWTESAESQRSVGYSVLPSSLGQESAPSSLPGRPNDRTAPAPLSFE